MNFSIKTLAATLAVVTTSVYAQEPATITSGGHHHAHIAEGLRSPLSIMSDHIHDAGDWMVSYRYMFMDMDGMRRGSHRVSNQEVFANRYAVTPERMTMEMQMVGLMYSPTERFTFMAMLNYTSISMLHQINPVVPLLGGSRFTTHAEGIGDTTLSGIFKLHSTESMDILAGLGFSLPTGSIGRQDGILTVPPPGINVRQLPAAMQLGSGTVDILPSLTVTKQIHEVLFGAQARGTIRTSDNTHGYRFGHAFDADFWGSWAPLSWFSFSAGLGYHYEGQMRGQQSGVAQASPVGLSVPTAYSANYGGTTIDAILGVNFLVSNGPLKGNRFAVDLRLPLYRRVNGLQLENDLSLTAGWTWNF